MSDLNKEALDVWGALKPMIDQEISSRTQGMVQRRKAKVTTAPSLATNTIGVTEAFGDEMFLPFVSNMISAKVGDFVWIEWMYGATNAFVSSFAAVDNKDVSVAGVLDVVPRRCYATLSSEGWYRVLVYNAVDSGATTGGSGLVVDFNIQRATRAENHSITLRCASTGLISFVNEQSKSYLCYIDKIRYVYDSTNLKAYVDIHYTGSDLSSTPVGVDFSVHCSSFYMQESIVSGNFAAAATSPVSPETVLTTYTFTANTEGTGTITAGTYTGSIASGTYIYRQGKIVTGFIRAVLNSTAAANGWREIAIIPSGFRPISNTEFNAIDDASTESIQTRIAGNGTVNIWPLADKPSGRNIIVSFTYYTG